MSNIEKIREPDHNLKDVTFPDCASMCLAVEHLGCGECNSICPWKFKKEKLSCQKN